MTTSSQANGIFSSQDLARVALNNGFPRDKDKLIWAVSTAVAESSGNPNAVNPLNPNAIGLWQIEASAHPEFDRSKLKDPDYNAQCMVKLSNGGTNRSPWVSSVAGQKLYKGYAEIGVMDVLRDPNAGLNGGDPGAAIGETIPGDKGKGPINDAVNAVTNPLASISAFLEKIATREFWRRAVEVIAGIVLVVVGLVILNRDLIGKAAAAAAVL